MQDTHHLKVIRWDRESATEIHDDVVVEEPLEVRVNQQSIGVTMRTPGDDFDLAIGLLRTEGIIDGMAEVGTIAYCPDEQDPHLKNIVNVTLVDSVRRFESLRNGWASSSCGLCGKASLDAIRRTVPPIRSTITIRHGVISELPQRLRERQRNFDRTGGIHAAGLFDAGGRLLLIREDLGRHNAVDKVFGAALRASTPTIDSILVVSGRLGFEIAQKALALAVPIVASVSAPSSLAIELALEFDMTAIGFVRDGSMNIYSHPERIIHGI